jgi:hypothetical protein
VSPIQKCCTSPPHEEATLPSWFPLPWPSPLPLPLPSATPTLSLLLSLSPLPSQSPIAVAAAVGHCWGHREPLLPPSLSRCCQPSLLPLPLLSDIAVSVIISHCSCHRHRPSPLAISKSCCLGAARIVFNQSKQRMLTLFYFVGTVGGELIKAGSLTRCRAAMANTSVGRQAVSS